MIFDTHAHYDDEAFDADREEILHSLSGTDISRVMNCGADLASSKRSVELAHEYDFIYAAVGVHPDNAGEIAGSASERLGSDNPDAGESIVRAAEQKSPGLERLRELASDSRVAAIGEIGLDYHWDVHPRDIQKEAFVKQWELAIELGLPIEIHSRDAAEDTMIIVRDMYNHEKRAGRALRADLHCYSYSPEQAVEYAKMGLYFGVGGVITFKNAKKLREVVDLVPIEQILLETDCPYLAPEPHRGSRNYSGYLHSVVAEIARIKGLSEEEIEKITYENACRFFGLKCEER